MLAINTPRSSPGKAGVSIFASVSASLVAQIASRVVRLYMRMPRMFA